MKETIGRDVNFHACIELICSLPARVVIESNSKETKVDQDPSQSDDEEVRTARGYQHTDGGVLECDQDGESNLHPEIGLSICDSALLVTVHGAAQVIADASARTHRHS